MALYFAYGSNLDPQGMRARCPSAVVVGRAALADWRLTFRGVADVEPAEGERVEGLIWDCSAECIRRLDRYEGVAGGFYRKEILEVETQFGGGTCRALVYIMNPSDLDDVSLPSLGYLQTIARGYRAFNIPTRSLRRALQRTKERCAQAGVTRWVWPEGSAKRARPVASQVGAR